MADDPVSAALEQAARCLERGDYGQALRLLTPLADSHGPISALGGRLRLQMATALMGQGHTERAADVCRSVVGCRDSLLRSQARDLLLVLEAPALRRPPEWSLTLPRLPEEPLQGAARGRSRGQAQGPPAPPPPPVGRTRAPLGFALVVILVVLVLTNLLAGCVQVRSEIRFEGPGRLRISHELGGAAGRPSPWQQRLVADLRARGYRAISTAAVDRQRLEGPVLPAAEGLVALGDDLGRAAALAGLPLPAPQWQFRERNWLVGVQQSFSLDLDLRPLSGLEAADLSLALGPLSRRAVRQSLPLAVHPAGMTHGKRGIQVWPLQVGALNQLHVRTWRWSPLGLGAGLIGLLLGLVLGLQRLRLALGFGPPQLPA
ncbi:MAG: DUF3153 domain-containing protein [Cyanobacteriota bacterium]|nr:DUF3153 domain-containing protein [Cyanobacteriota bacterium]